MSSHLVRRSTAVTAGAILFAGLAGAPIAAFADAPAGTAEFDSAVTVSGDPDGAGQLYTLNEDVSTYSTITLPESGSRPPTRAATRTAQRATGRSAGPAPPQRSPPAPRPCSPRRDPTSMQRG